MNTIGLKLREVKMDVQHKIETAKNIVDAGIATGATLSFLEMAHWGVAIVTVILGVMRIVVEFPRFSQKMCQLYAWVKSKLVKAKA